MEENVFEQMGAQNVKAPNEKGKSPTAELVEEILQIFTLGERAAENTLKLIAKAILFVGILASFFCLFALSWDNGHFVFSRFLIAIGILISSLSTWAVMSVLANISNTLMDIKNKK